MTAGQEEKLARRYGRALFTECDPSSFDKTIEQLSVLAQLWQHVTDFRECVTNPRITVEQRVSTLEAIMSSRGGWVTEPLKKTADLLVGARKAAVFPKLYEIFEGLVREYRRNLALELTVASPISNEEIDRMRGQLSSALGGDVTLSTRHDPSLLGGITVRMGDRYLDRSVAGTLNRLAEQLMR